MRNKGKRWFYYTICVHPNKNLNEPDNYGNTFHSNHHHKHLLKTFNYPDHIIKKRKWFLEYLVAKYKVRFPRHQISLHLCPYYPSDNDPILLKKRKIAAAKGQITKIENLIKFRKKELFSEIFSDTKTDPLMIMYKRKLEEKIYKLDQLIKAE